MSTTLETKKRGRPRKAQDTQGQMSIFSGTDAGREARAVITAASEEQEITQIADALVAMYDGALATIDKMTKDILSLTSSGTLDKSILDDVADAQGTVLAAAVSCSHVAIKLRRAAEAYKTDTARQERVQKRWAKIYETQEEPAPEDTELSEEFIAAIADFYGLPADDPDFSLEDAFADLRQSIKKAAFAEAGIEL